MKATPARASTAVPNLSAGFCGECDGDRADAHEREEHDGDVHQEWVGRQAEQGGDLHVSLSPILRRQR